jgi:hypothetical protein
VPVNDPARHRAEKFDMRNGVEEPLDRLPTTTTSLDIPRE